MSSRESVTVLEECVELQKRKSQDYQNPNSNIKQAMHYRRGVSTIHDMIQQKLYRAQSLLEPLENGDLAEPNFESLEDTYKDAINYLSFAVSFIRGKMEGQDSDRDMLNRVKPDTSGGSSSGLVNVGDEIIIKAYPEGRYNVTIGQKVTDVGDRIDETFGDMKRVCER